MEIKDVNKTVPHCEVCTQGKFIQTRNRAPDARAKAPLEMGHTDLAGPIDPMSRERHRYTTPIILTLDFPSRVTSFTSCRHPWRM